MAGFFGMFNYEKPGPGVSKDEPEKHGLFLFFDIFFRKFWNLVKLNMLYFVSVFLFYIPLVLVIIPFFVKIGNNSTSNFLISCTVNGMKVSMINPFLYFYILPIMLASPAMAGFTYILRSYVKQEHAFIWMDYKDTIKKNWKQSLLAGFINITVGMLLVETIPFYFQAASGNKIFLFPLAISLLLSITFLFMQYYIYMMIITFDLKLSQIYKNAAIFAVVGLGRNLLLTIVIALIVFFVFVMPVLGVLLTFLILLSFLGLMISFASWSLLKKMMIDPYEKKYEDQSDTEESVFSDREEK